MNKLIVITALAFFYALNLTAQIRYYTNHPFIYDESGNRISFYKTENGRGIENHKNIQKRVDLKLKEYKTVTPINKGKDQATTIYSYNEQGRLSQIKRFDENNELRYLTTLKYTRDSLLSEYIGIDKKKRETKYLYKYDENGRFISNQQVKHGTVKGELICTYNAKGKVTSRLHKYGRKLKYSSETKNYYNANDDLVKTESYYKGKLKNVYNYDCKPEGEKEVELDKKVTSSDICEWTEESRDGSYKVYFRTTNEKRMYLNINKYNKDSVLIESNRFLNDSILVNHSLNFENTRSYSNYNKKGKLLHFNSSTSNEKGDLILSTRVSYWGSRKAYTNMTENKYDEQGLISETTLINGKNKPRSIKYYYTFY
jgi:hypothetical protein